MPKLQEALTKAGAAYGVNVWEKGTVEPGSGNTWSAAFDTGLSQEQQLALSRAIDEALGDTDITWNYFRSYRAEAADDFYGTYGSLFFIGIVLSVLFICAAVLIIYYKQLCEGYEDQPRFAIMQKVGMTAADIRRSVNSQLLTVFFLPLAGAALHMAFAFPMIRRMLLLFELHGTVHRHSAGQLRGTGDGVHAGVQGHVQRVLPDREGQRVRENLLDRQVREVFCGLLGRFRAPARGTFGRCPKSTQKDNLKPRFQDFLRAMLCAGMVNFTTRSQNTVVIVSCDASTSLLRRCRSSFQR